MTEDTQEKVVNAYQIACRGDFDHARMILEEALYDNSENIEAWLLLADLAEDQDEARQCYQMILEINPDNWIAQQRLKLLFSKQIAVDSAVEKSFGTKVEVDEFPAFEDFPMDDEPGDIAESSSWKELVKNNRRFFIKLGAGVGGLFLLMIIAWLASVGFMAWRLGYLIVGG